mgnify:CR=1 FL=1
MRDLVALVDRAVVAALVAIHALPDEEDADDVGEHHQAVQQHLPQEVAAEQRVLVRTAAAQTNMSKGRLKEETNSEYDLGSPARFALQQIVVCRLDRERSRCSKILFG